MHMSCLLPVAMVTHFESRPCLDSWPLQFSIPTHPPKNISIVFYGSLILFWCLPSLDPDLYNDVERFLMDQKHITHLILTFYELLYSHSTGDITQIAQKWERDFDTQYIEEKWLEAINAFRSTCTCNRLRETQYKIQ